TLTPCPIFHDQLTGLAFTDDAIRSKAAPTTGGNPSSAECPGVLVVPRRPPRQARRPTSAHGGFRVVQSAFGGPHDATESKASKWLGSCPKIRLYAIALLGKYCG